MTAAAVWACGSCSTTNNGADPHCAVCGTARPVAPFPTAVPTVVAAPAAPAPGPTPDPTTVVPAVSQYRGAAPPLTAAPLASTAVDLGRPAAPGRRPPTVLVAAIAVVVALVVGAGVFFLVSGSQRDDDTAQARPTTVDQDDPDDEDEDEGSGPESTLPRESADDEVPAAPEVEVPPVVAAPTDARRPATLYSSDAKLRDGPSLSAGEVTRITGRDGLSITVIGSINAQGWYHVEIDGRPGYLYGAFVRPPDPGWCVATGRGGAPRMWTFEGDPITDNESGTKLVVRFVGDEVEGTLASGRVVLVDGSSIDTACG